MTIDTDISKLSTTQNYTSAGDRIQNALNQRGPNAAQQESGTPTTGDTVSLTETAARMQQLSSELSNQPVIDNDRVAELRKAIESGTYQVDSQRIAGKMIDLEELF